VIVLAAAGCVTGCSENDESVTTIDEETALRQSLGVVEVVDAMLARVDEIAEGEIASISAPAIPGTHSPEGRSADGPVWDPVGEQWINVIEYESDHGMVFYLFTIQFTDADGTHPRAPGKNTDYATYGLLADMTSTYYGHGDEVAHDMHYACSLGIGDLGASTHAVSGTGEMSGTLTGTKDGRPLDAQISMTWEVDVAMPSAGGCGTGSVTVVLGAYVLQAFYGPQPAAYHWQFMLNDQPISTGSGAAACGKAKTVNAHPAPDL
jgi:hypothetical protein